MGDDEVGEGKTIGVEVRAGDAVGKGDDEGDGDNVGIGEGIGDGLAAGAGDGVAVGLGVGAGDGDGDAERVGSELGARRTVEAGEGGTGVRETAGAALAAVEEALVVPPVNS